MMALSHMVFGLTTWGLVSGVTDVQAGAAGFAMAFAGSVAPDIDHPKSWIGRRLLPLSLPISAVFGHRGITHSILAVLAASLAVWYYGSVGGGMVLAFAVGYLSHLVGDLISNSGIPAFWPIKKRVSLHLINTGGFSEMVFMAAFVSGSVYLILNYLPRWRIDLLAGL